MKIRFLHAADVHLDSPMRGLARYEGAPAQRLRVATRDAFSALVDLAIEEQVSFVIIAGDLYDGSQFNVNTGLFFCREMGRLGRAGIPAYIVHGNHDAESQITRKLPWPKNVHVFSQRKAETLRIAELNVALHGRSYSEAAVTENLVPGYPDPVPGSLNIGVLHTALEGYVEHARYAPCTVAELQARHYDYWALGHVHEHEIRTCDPWIVFPGNVQGRSIRETGPRGAMLVTAESGRIVSAERVHLDKVRWEHLRIDARDARTTDDLLTQTDRLLGDLVRAADGRLLAVRVTFEGPSAAHGELVGAEGLLRARLLAISNAIDGESIWVEKVCVDTQPAMDADALAARADAVADLQMMLTQAAQDHDLVDGIAGELRALTAGLPKGFREDEQRLRERDAPVLDLLNSGNVRGLIEKIGPDLIARLETR